MADGLVAAVDRAATAREASPCSAPQRPARSMGRASRAASVRCAACARPAPSAADARWPSEALAADPVRPIAGAGTATLAHESAIMLDDERTSREASAAASTAAGTVPLPGLGPLAGQASEIEAPEPRPASEPGKSGPGPPCWVSWQLPGLFSLPPARAFAPAGSIASRRQSTVKVTIGRGRPTARCRGVASSRAAQVRLQQAERAAGHILSIH